MIDSHYDCHCSCDHCSIWTARSSITPFTTVIVHHSTLAFLSFSSCTLPLRTRSRLTLLLPLPSLHSPRPPSALVPLLHSSYSRLRCCRSSVLSLAYSHLSLMARDHSPLNGLRSNEWRGGGEKGRLIEERGRHRMGMQTWEQGLEVGEGGAVDSLCH
jgi:hypothetical protein